MFFKKETEYALLGLTALSEEAEFIDVRKLAKEKNLPEALLSKTFQKLTLAGVLESKVGPNGGVKLRKSPKKTTLLEIVEAIQDIKTLKCFEGEAPYCEKGGCILKKKISEIEQNIQTFLMETTLEDLRKESK